MTRDGVFVFVVIILAIPGEVGGGGASQREMLPFLLGKRKSALAGETEVCGLCFGRETIVSIAEGAEILSMRTHESISRSFLS